MAAIPVHASKPRSLVEATRIMLDEMLKALTESITGLTTAQAWEHPVPNRHCIGIIVLHVQQNIDAHACRFQVGRFALDHDSRFDFYGRPVSDFLDLQDVPDIATLQLRQHALRDAVLETLDGVDDATLYTPRAAEQTHWWQQHQRVSLDAYHRVVWHANSHIRQIWCLRGAMGAVDADHFPQQFWH